MTVCLQSDDHTQVPTCRPPNGASRRLDVVHSFQFRIDSVPGRVRARPENRRRRRHGTTSGQDSHQSGQYTAFHHTRNHAGRIGRVFIHPGPQTADGFPSALTALFLEHGPACKKCFVRGTRPYISYMSCSYSRSSPLPHTILGILLVGLIMRTSVMVVDLTRIWENVWNGPARDTQVSPLQGRSRPAVFIYSGWGPSCAHGRSRLSGVVQQETIFSVLPGASSPLVICSVLQEATFKATRTTQSQPSVHQADRDPLGPGLNGLGIFLSR